ncbi:hypothetical protein BDN72DRAFT_821154 [Pluteus cervinus]|uniref:Uncharacterized protein n=1 Tax=Pluteus cervinus TaxID=181527 RepID=A0ACD3AT23_9AGAR|nr:hypothetical protein BDN72DRAFT_821154 [Pluteus cervinus]
MFRDLLSSVTSGAENKSLPPTLRSDIYDAVDQVKAWTIGALGSGKAGDGVSYNRVLTIIQNHLPNTTLGLESIGSTENELSVIVGGVTNMILELSKWEGMAAGMAMNTWIDALVEAHARVEPGSRRDSVAKGITKGINDYTDVTLVPKEFTVKIGIISTLKNVGSRIYGAGSSEARSGEAVWSSKFLG